MERVGEVAYRLALPPRLSGVHNVFHVSMLRKYEPDPSHVLNWQDLEIEEDVSYEERPVEILDSREQVLRGKTIPLVKGGDTTERRRPRGNVNKKSVRSIPTCSPIEVFFQFRGRNFF